MAASALIAESATRMASAQRMRLLVISPEAEDRELLQQFLDKTQWDLSQVTTCGDGLQLIGCQRFSAIFCEAASNDIGWRDLLRLAGSLETPPLVVISRLADVFLWCEVLNLGGYDVLAKPFDAKEVAHVLETIALQNRQTKRFRSEAGFGEG
jgi:DNA-binding response OmpR family regulator